MQSNPWSYFTIAMAANEFTAGSWSQPVSDTDPTPIGIAVLQSRGFGTEYYWVSNVESRFLKKK